MQHTIYDIVWQNPIAETCVELSKKNLTTIWLKMPLSCKVWRIVIVLIGRGHALVILVSHGRRLDLEKNIIFRTSLLSSLGHPRLLWLLKFSSSLNCSTILETILTGSPTLLATTTPFIPPWHIPTMHAQVSFGIVIIYQCKLRKKLAYLIIKIRQCKVVTSY